MPGTGLGKYQQGRIDPVEAVHGGFLTNPGVKRRTKGQALHFVRAISHVIPKTMNSVLKDHVKNLHRLPEVEVQLPHRTLAALLDSGSEVTCIAEEIYLEMLHSGYPVPKLPVPTLCIRGAVGQKGCKVNLQVLIEISMLGQVCLLSCLVVPGLIKPLILGTDWLLQNAALLDYHHQELTFHLDGKSLTVPFLELLPMENIENSESSGVYSLQRMDIEEKSNTLSSKVQEASLTTKQSYTLLKLLKQNQLVFSPHPGRTQLYHHQIRLHDETPFVRRSYPIPNALRQPVQQAIEEMLQLGIIKREASAYSSPLTVVKKKDGSVRVCLDARLLNDRMVSDCEGPPPVEELLHRFQNVRFMTTLDLTSSYWQIPLEPDSTKFTAFLYDGRSYTFQVLPFGLKTAVASFSRCMDLVLGPEIREFAINYIDDLLIASSDFDAHIQHLQTVFFKLNQAGFKINLSKSHFCRTEVKFLGHILTPEGIQTDPEKIQAIVDFPIPTKVKHIRAFLGLCNYYRKFQKNYSYLTRPLEELLKKNTVWRWAVPEQEAMEKVKRSFLSAVMLRHPIPGQEFFLQTDSSDYALGAELYQVTSDKDKGVIAFASRSLRSYEVRYTTTERELLAIIYALQKFRTYIQGAKLTIRTDHYALKFLKQCRLLNGRLTRWVLFLQQFNYSVEYVKGKENIGPDILSRYPPGDSLIDTSFDGPLIAACVIQSEEEFNEQINQLKELQQTDAHLRSYFVSPENLGPSFVIAENDLLYYVDPKTRHLRLVIPEVLINSIIHHAHLKLSHYGSEKVYEFLKIDLYWKRMRRSVGNLIRSCVLCQKSKVRNKNYTGAWVSIRPTTVGELLSVDFFGPLPKSFQGATYLFVVQDLFSKYIKLFPLKKATADAAFRKLIEDVVPLLQPQAILSDHGTQFTSKAWHRKLQEKGIRATHSSIRHPESNPVERSMRELGRLFRTFCHDKHRDWARYIEKIEEAMNSVCHVSTGFPPHLVVHGTPPPLQIEQLRPYIMDSAPVNLEEIRQKVKENLNKEADRRERLGSNFSFEFHVGQRVLLQRNNHANLKPGECPKLHLLYDGPFLINRKPYPNAYELIDINNQNKKGTYNGKLLRPFYSI